jgi:hypothetical protein
LSAASSAAPGGGEVPHRAFMHRGIARRRAIDEAEPDPARQRGEAGVKNAAQILVGVRAGQDEFVKCARNARRREGARLASSARANKTHFLRVLRPHNVGFGFDFPRSGHDFRDFRNKLAEQRIRRANQLRVAFVDAAIYFRLCGYAGVVSPIGFGPRRFEASANFAKLLKRSRFGVLERGEIAIELFDGRFAFRHKLFGVLDSILFTRFTRSDEIVAELSAAKYVQNVSIAD